VNLLALVVGYIFAKMLGKLQEAEPMREAPVPGPVYPPGYDERTRPARPKPTHRPTGRVQPVSYVTPPWPQVVPQGLPAFPGPGWTPDEPPPPAVVSRANELLKPLWGSGEGTFKVEKTAGRWIVYRATAMGDKKGVIAYREAGAPVPHDAFGPLVEPEPSPVIDLDQGATQNASYTRPVSPSPAVALPTLRRGSSGDEVMLVQQRLGLAPVDGKFGPMTETAVRKFQSSNGLTADGVVGRMTWGALLGKSA
jgi:hypothetical protein